MTLLENNDQDTEGRKSSFNYDLKTSHINRIIYFSFLIQFLFNLILIFSIEFGNQHHYGLKKFYFDLEESVPTYFSSIILLFTSACIDLQYKIQNHGFILRSLDDNFSSVSGFIG